MKHPFALLIFAGSCLTLSCSNTIDNDLISNRTPDSLTIPVKADPSFSWAPAVGSVSLGNIVPRKAAEPVLLTIGCGAASGYRDGGLTRQGQLTSYPNLVAHQMGLANFQQALFSLENGNGTGYIIKSKDGGWSRVVNNTAYAFPGSMNMIPSDNKVVHNLSVPGNHPNKYGIDPNEDMDYAIKFYEKNPDSKRPLDMNLLWTTNEQSMALMARMISRESGTTYNYLLGLEPDAAIVDINADIFAQIHIGGGDGGILAFRESFWEIGVIEYLKQKGAKYVYTTVPDVLDFPYFHEYSENELSKIHSNPVLFFKDGAPNPAPVPDGSIFLPTRKVKRLFSGKFTEGEYLTDIDVITSDEASRPVFYNEYVHKLAKEYEHPIVDFYGIYKKIIAGSYVTDDGLKISASSGDLSFFSSDGIYPSAIGQAVLANEVIKVFNSSYNTKIPLINVTIYAMEIKKIK